MTEDDCNRMVHESLCDDVDNASEIANSIQHRQLMNTAAELRAGMLDARTDEERETLREMSAAALDAYKAFRRFKRITRRGQSLGLTMQW